MTMSLLLILGGIFMAQAVVLFTALGYFSGSIGGYLLARPLLARYLDGLTAGVFTALALRLAFAERLRGEGRRAKGVSHGLDG